MIEKLEPASLDYLRPEVTRLATVEVRYTRAHADTRNPTNPLMAKGFYRKIDTRRYTLKYWSI
jgi:hypothetical protein